MDLELYGGGLGASNVGSLANIASLVCIPCWCYEETVVGGLLDARVILVGEGEGVEEPCDHGSGVAGCCTVQDSNGAFADGDRRCSHLDQWNHCIMYGESYLVTALTTELKAASLRRNLTQIKLHILTKDCQLCLSGGSTNTVRDHTAIGVCV